MAGYMGIELGEILLLQLFYWWIKAFIMRISCLPSDRYHFLLFVGKWTGGLGIGWVEVMFMAVVRVIEVGDTGVVKMDDAFCSDLPEREKQSREDKVQKRLDRLLWEHTVRKRKEDKLTAGEKGEVQ